MPDESDLRGDARRSGGGRGREFCDTRYAVVGCAVVARARRSGDRLGADCTRDAAIACIDRRPVAAATARLVLRARRAVVRAPDRAARLDRLGPIAARDFRRESAQEAVNGESRPPAARWRNGLLPLFIICHLPFAVYKFRRLYVLTSI